MNGKGRIRSDPFLDIAWGRLGVLWRVKPGFSKFRRNLNLHYPELAFEKNILEYSKLKLKFQVEVEVPS